MTEAGDQLMQAQRAERQRRKKASPMIRCPICGRWPDKGHAPYCIHRRHEDAAGKGAMRNE
jgi:hypothetical protein